MSLPRPTAPFNRAGAPGFTASAAPSPSARTDSNNTNGTSADRTRADGSDSVLGGSLGPSAVGVIVAAAAAGNGSDTGAQQLWPVGVAIPVGRALSREQLSTSSLDTSFLSQPSPQQQPQQGSLYHPLQQQQQPQPRAAPHASRSPPPSTLGVPTAARTAASVPLPLSPPRPTASTTATVAATRTSVIATGATAAAAEVTAAAVRSAPSSNANAPTASSAAAAAGYAPAAAATPTPVAPVAAPSPSQAAQQQRAASLPSPTPPGVITTSATGANTTSTDASSGGASIASMMLTQPLAMQATVLRHPDWFEQSALPEMVEPGDILFDVLGAPHLSLLPQQQQQQHKSKQKHQDPSSFMSSFSTETTAAAAMLSPFFGVQPLLALPDKVGAYLARESFQALLCFSNGANYPLSNLRFRVDVLAPPPPQQQLSSLSSPPSSSSPSASLTAQIPIAHKDVNTLAARANYAFPIDVPLEATGTYTLSVLVQYTDPAGIERKLSWASSFPVEAAVTEAEPRRLVRVPLPLGEGRRGSGGGGTDLYRAYFPLHTDSDDQDNRDDVSDGCHGTNTSTCKSRFAPPPPPLTLIDSLRDPRLPRCYYSLTVHLRSSCHVQFALANVRLRLPRGGPCVMYDPNSSSGNCGGEMDGHCDGNTNSNSAVGVAKGQESYSAMMTPGERRRYTFHFMVDPAALVRCPHSPNANSNHDSTAIGCVEWTWRRSNGDGGTERSAPVRLGPLLATPEVEVFVLGVEPEAEVKEAATTATPLTSGNSAAGIHKKEINDDGNDDNEEDEDEDEDELSSGPMLRAGALATISLCVVHTPLPQYHHHHQQLRSTSDADANADTPPGIDLALKVRPEKLAPYFLYSGPALRPLGLAAHGGGRGAPKRLTLTVMPWQSGRLRLSQDAFQLVDMRAPEVILWPPPPPLPSSSSVSPPPSAAATTQPASAAVSATGAMKVTSPVSVPLPLTSSNSSNTVTAGTRVHASVDARNYTRGSGTGTNNNHSHTHSLSASATAGRLATGTVLGTGAVADFKGSTTTPSTLFTNALSASCATALVGGNGTAPAVASAVVLEEATAAGETDGSTTAGSRTGLGGGGGAATAARAAAAGGAALYETIAQ